MLNITCVKLGAKYDAQYVNRLRSMTARHLSLPHRFVCITDDARGLAEGVVAAPSAEGLSGWWGKPQVFSPNLFDHSDYILFLDLDIVVVGDLSGAVEYGMERITRRGAPMVILEDFNRPGGYGSAVFMLRAGALPHAYNDFMAEKDAVMARYHGDQDWLEKAVPGAHFWPREWMLSYKVDKLFLQPPPPSARIVCFHGSPKNHEVKGWVEKEWI